MKINHKLVYLITKINKCFPFYHSTVFSLELLTLGLQFSVILIRKLPLMSYYNSLKINNNVICMHKIEYLELHHL